MKERYEKNNIDLSSKNSAIIRKAKKLDSSIRNVRHLVNNKMKKSININNEELINSLVLIEHEMNNKVYKLNKTLVRTQEEIYRLIGSVNQIKL